MKVMESLVKDYINFADNHFQTHTCTVKCSECKDDCIMCLDDQNFKGIAREYDCEKRCGAYVCHYFFRHMPEMCYLAREMKYLPETIKILSIGCGPCSELIGIMANLPKTYLNYNIDFLGIDMSKKWSPFHQQLSKLMVKHNRNVSVRFLYKDIDNAMDELMEERFDIVVMNYFLSDYRFFYKDNIVPVINLCHSLNKAVFSKMPNNSHIMINDINHKKARDCFDVLVRSVKRKKIDEYFRFEKPYDVSQEYTLNYNMRKNVLWELQKHFFTEPFELDYSPRTDCASAQVLVQLK